MCRVGRGTSPTSLSDRTVVGSVPGPALHCYLRILKSRRARIVKMAMTGKCREWRSARPSLRHRDPPAIRKNRSSREKLCSAMPGFPEYKIGLMIRFRDTHPEHRPWRPKHRRTGAKRNSLGSPAAHNEREMLSARTPARWLADHGGLLRSADRAKVEARAASLLEEFAEIDSSGSYRSDGVTCLPGLALCHESSGAPP